MLAAGLLAVALVLARLGLRARPVVAAAATSVPTATALLWLGAPALVDFAGFDWRAVGIFAAAGVLFPIGVTLLSFETNRRMGPAMAGALANTTPVFALGFAALLLGEHVSALRGAGALVVIAGVIVLTRPWAFARRDWPLWVIVLPLAAACIRGIVQPAVKLGLGLWPDAYAASLVGYSVSSCIILTLRAIRGGSRTRWRDRGMFMLVGVCNAASVVLMYAALARGSVGLVAPLIASYPLFTLALGAVVLREERLGAPALAGVAVTVLGVGLVLAG
jgi:drug/metabolite transporter (DMT)-like permease